ncbi:MAG: hypothetical protein QNJ41_20555 [Xenococcaceae cyanobacterium MO_188.B32]|nr:hypothetical protein [Xenococcaceae cyanobacterium MO_188.B32]
MARSNQLISAPNIYLFTFQQQQEFFSQSSLEPLSPEWSTHKYCQILNHFHVCQKIKLNSRVDKENLVDRRQNYPQDITQKQQFWGTIKTQENLELIQGEAYPSCADTSHIISLRIHRQEKNAKEAISIDKLAFFNPKNCFSPHNIQTNLGQTLVITALVNNKENMQPDSLKSLADSCLSCFAHLPNSSQKTVSIDSSIIANGYFSTYYLPGNSRQYNQIIICLFFRQKDQDNFHRHHQQLSKFFFSLHKLTYVHQYSNNLFKLACYQIDRLKYHLKTLNSSDLAQFSSPNDVRVKYSSVYDQNRIDWHSHKNSFSQINRKPIAGQTHLN